MPFCLIWICTHGKGGTRRTWRQKDLKIMGVYSTKADAEDAKRQLMQQHECYGHGDICVGGTWEDEIDLVVREGPRAGTAFGPQPTKASVLLWICTHGKGRRKQWRQKDLKVVGIYPTKASAEQGRSQVMQQHDCYGHGDICVGGTWEDEIDLVVRDNKGPMNL